MTPEEIRTLHDYNFWTHRRVWACIEQLTDEQFTRHFDYSIGSIRNHIVHVMSVDERWFARLQGIEPPPRLMPDEFPTRADARAKWDTIEASMRAYLDRLTGAELNESFDYDLSHRGGQKHDTRWQILVHVVNHGTDHRAQILSLLYALGAPTTEQDLTAYLWE